MKKLLLVLGVLMGLVGLSVSSYAIQFRDSTNKTFFQQPLVSSATNGNTAFVTTTQSSGTNSYCSNSTQGVGPYVGALLSCGATPISGISLTGGTSGGYVVVYDANTNEQQVNQTTNLFPGEVGVQEVVFETYVPANTGLYIDLSAAPIQTINGVVAYAGVTTGVEVYSSKNGVANN